MTRTWKMLAVMFPLALVAACTDANKAPAEAAMTAASAALDSLKGDAAKFAPDAVKAIESSYATARDSMANKDYAGVLTFARDIPAKAKEALAQAAARKEAIGTAWNGAGDRMAKILETAKQRLDVLAHGKKLPAGVDKAAIEKAHGTLAELQSGWSAVVAQHDSGDWSGAVAKASELETRGAELLRSIGAQ